jgi:4-amino-4-deoxy-L-arabinose transferase-like glycosyltransferase
MWHRGEFLVPHLNGQPYSDKPPLLFWLMNAGWAVFGVHEWWARLVPSLFALGNLFLTARLARKLWPDRPDVAAAAPLLLLSTFLWSFFTTVLLFDMLLVFFALTGIHGIVRASRGERGGWLLYAFSIGVGILAKGPAILLWLAPAAIAAPWWAAGESVRAGRWYARVAAAVAGGIAIALAWAVPAAMSGGSAYANAILWNQTAGRVAHAFAHRQPFWWYLPFAPLLLFPWILWKAAWRRSHILRNLTSDRGVRLSAVWAIAGFVAFSLVSGKQVQYLLPLLPAVSLIGARLVTAEDAPVRRGELAGVAACFFVLAAALGTSHWVADGFGLPEWVAGIPQAAGAIVAALGVLLLVVRPGSRVRALELVAACSLAAVVAALVAVGRSATPLYDVSRVARLLGRLEREGHPLAHVGRYRGEYQFAGRLRNPLEVIGADDLPRWFERHPDGYVVLYSRRHLLAPEADDELRHDYRGGVVLVRHRFSGVRGRELEAPMGGAARP